VSGYRLVGCAGCGAFQHAPERRGAGVLSCAVCATQLERADGQSLDAALACSAATFLLLFPANLLPFLSTAVLGVTRQSRLASSASAMWGDGWPWLALVIVVLLVIAPFLRFGLLTVVLGTLKLGRRPPWLGPAFRWADGLQVWAMTDVFLVGLWVAYTRLAAVISVTVEMGAVCFILAGLLTLFTRAALQQAVVWEAIMPAPRHDPSQGEALACPACAMVLPQACMGTACPRCGAKVHARRANAVAGAAALTLAAFLLYLPANLYPMATLPVGLTPSTYTVLQGVVDLVKNHLYGLGLLVFTASFAVPFLKLSGLMWCIASVLRRSGRRLVLKTRLYRVVEEIGRWSMVDPFVIACFVPVMQYNGLIYGQANAAAPAFTAVVMLTMIATRCFDPRLMWDAVGERS
jgi:paraquat-inducible protein A